jgi:hypothetical protein
MMQEYICVLVSSDNFANCKDRPVHIVVAEIADELAVWELARGRQLTLRE